MISRRGVWGGLIGVLAAPAIITTPGLLMPMRPIRAGTYEEALAWIRSELMAHQQNYRRQSNADYLPLYGATESSQFGGHAMVIGRTIEPGVWAGRQPRQSIILPFVPDNA
jgi:hypothetical protein